MSGFVFFGFSKNASSLVSGWGANVSMYLGVKSKTRAIKKNARRVFLSILFYGVFPPFAEGVAPGNSF